MIETLRFFLRGAAAAFLAVGCGMLYETLVNPKVEFFALPFTLSVFTLITVPRAYRRQEER